MIVTPIVESETVRECVCAREDFNIDCGSRDVSRGCAEWTVVKNLPLAAGWLGATGGNWRGRKRLTAYISLESSS